MDEPTTLQGLVPYGVGLWGAALVLAIIGPPLFVMWRGNRWQIGLKTVLVFTALFGPLSKARKVYAGPFGAGAEITPEWMLVRFLAEHREISRLASTAWRIHQVTQGSRGVTTNYLGFEVSEGRGCLWVEG